MINLILGINAVFVTLRERAELANADILVELTNRDTKTDAKTLLTADTSASTDRVSEIAVEVVAAIGGENLPNGQVYLISGDYQYRIFESPLGSGLDIAGKKLLEIGVLNFNTDKAKTEYERTTNKVIYEG